MQDAVGGRGSPAVDDLEKPAALLLGVSWQDGRHLLGGLLSLAAAVFYTGYLLLISAARREAEVVAALFLAGCPAAGVLGLYGLLGGDPFFGFPAHSWAAFAGAAVVSRHLQRRDAQQ